VSVEVSAAGDEAPGLLKLGDVGPEALCWVSLEIGSDGLALSELPRDGDGALDQVAVGAGGGGGLLG